LNKPIKSIAVFDEQDSAVMKAQNFRYFKLGSCHKRQKPQAPTPQALIRNR